jgi:NADH-quinone oxidoreductase subunit L
MTTELYAMITLLVVGAPAGTLTTIGAALIIGLRPSEKLVRRFVMGGQVVALLASVLLLGVTAELGYRTVDLGTWFSIGAYDFALSLMVDPLSLVMLFLVAGLCALVGHYSANYMHRDAGFSRFFLLLSLFQTGMTVLVLAGSLDLMFVGWELVGFSSALLIAFFQWRDEPARSGLHAFVTYRAADVGLLIGAVLLHHFTHVEGFDTAFRGGEWPLSVAHLQRSEATAIALMLLLASMGKSAQFPLGGWLPRAMEGPTPSSAIFYGALSIHAGAYLLLRAEPLLRDAPYARMAVIAVGLCTALYGTVCGRVQTDIKSALAFASMTQVGLIFVEIGLQWYRFALWHVGAHAVLRSWQFLRAPSLLLDMQHIQRSLGHNPSARWEDKLSASARASLYRFSLERGYLTWLFEKYLLMPIEKLSLFMRTLEYRMEDMLRLSGSSDASKKSDA